MSRKKWFTELKEELQITNLPNVLLDMIIGYLPVPFYGKCVNTLTGHTDRVFCLAVLPDGTLASGSYDRTIKLWQ